jgi:hypothetical protein
MSKKDRTPEQQREMDLNYCAHWYYRAAEEVYQAALHMGEALNLLNEIEDHFAMRGMPSCREEALPTEEPLSERYPKHKKGELYLSDIHDSLVDHAQILSAFALEHVQEMKGDYDAWEADHIVHEVQNITTMLNLALTRAGIGGESAKKVLDEALSKIQKA